jgi:adenylate kinase
MVNNRLLLLGPPGAGKSVVAESLSNIFQLMNQRKVYEIFNLADEERAILNLYFHKLDQLPSGLIHDITLEHVKQYVAENPFTMTNISTGDAIRDKIKKGLLPQVEKDRTEKGQLVSDDYIIGTVLTDLLKPVHFKNFMLDGFPRTEVQLDYMWEMLGKYDDDHAFVGSPIDYAVHAIVPRDVAEKRITSRRACITEGCGGSYSMTSKDFFPDNMGMKSTKGDYETGLCKKCGSELILRYDDSPGKFATRWSQYENEVIPVIARLKDKYGMNIVEIPTDMPPTQMAIHLLIEIAKISPELVLKG